MDKIFLWYEKHNPIGLGLIDAKERYPRWETVSWL